MFLNIPYPLSLVDFPSAWLSIILKFFGRETDTDYKAFCQFIHLSIEPQVEDIEKKIAIKSSIIAINYAMLVDRFYGQQEAFKDDAKYLIKCLKKFMKK